MATQTGSYDFKAAKQAKLSAEATAAADATTKANDAKKVATNFIATDSLGMMVYDGTSGTHTPTNPGTNTRNVLIDSDSVDIRQGTDVLATFGSTTRIGQYGAENVTINNDGITVNTSDKESAMVLTSMPFNDSYGGEIVFGTDTTISGGADNSTSIVHAQAIAPTNTTDAAIYCDAFTPAGAQASVQASIDAGTPHASLYAQNSSGTKSSLIEVTDEAAEIYCVNGSKDNDTIIDSTGITTNGTLTVQGHSSPIGSIIEVENDTTTSIPSGTSTPLMSITLPSGVWVMRVIIRIPSMGTDRTKYVYANISGTSGATAYMYRAPCENVITEVMMTQIITAGGTYYVNVYQNSGSAKTFATGSNASQNIRAVRIA